MKRAIIENGLKKIYKDSPVRMHMPGHKGKKRHYRYDVTEIEGTDNLGDPQGIILEAQQKIADLFSAEQSYFLVGGATSGIQAATMAVFSKKDVPKKMLVPTNAHFSVYSALALAGAEPVLYAPDTEFPGMRVSLENIKSALEKNPDVGAVLITSPDYYGMVSDVKEIADYLDERGILLIIDAAHGAHLKYTPEIKNPVELGGDYVIESVHKTLGAPTQGALLHLKNRADPRRTQFALSLFQTSSPSYILLSGIEKAVDEAEEKGENVFRKIYAAHDALEADLENSDYLRLISPEGPYDKSKFVFLVNDAKELEEILKSEYKIFPEFAAGNVLLCMTGIGTSQRDLSRLLGSIKEIEKRFASEGKVIETEISGKKIIPEPALPFKEALFSEQESVALAEAEGRISGDFIIPYPPGTPIAIPGSKISKEVVEEIEKLLSENTYIRGIDRDKLEIFVLEK